MMSSSSSPILAEPQLLTLVDVDDTLIDSEGQTLNLALIEVLQEAGIRNICLFTSMYGWQVNSDLGSGETSYTRERLITELEQMHHLRVLKVITPADVYLNEPGHYYRHKWLPVYRDWKEKTQSINIFDSAHREMLLAMKRAVSAIDADIIQAEAQLHAHYRALLAQGLDEKAESFLARHRQTKGNMFTLVQAKMPSASYLYFEDKVSEIDNVEAANQGSNCLLTAIQVRHKSSDTLGDLPGNKETAEAYLKRKETIKHRYRAQLITHFSTLPQQETTHFHLVEIQQQHLQCLAAINALTNCLEHLSPNYERLCGKLSKHTHRENIKTLLEKAKDIQQSPLSSETVLEKLSQIILLEYLRLRNIQAAKSGSFLSKKKTFLERLNSEPENHHYARILGLIINSQHLSAQLTYVHSAMMLEVARLRAPNHQAYAPFVIHKPTTSAPSHQGI